jgi:hypothetical protein
MPPSAVGRQSHILGPGKAWKKTLREVCPPSLCKISERLKNMAFSLQNDCENRPLMGVTKVTSGQAAGTKRQLFSSTTKDYFRPFLAESMEQISDASSIPTRSPLSPSLSLFLCPYGYIMSHHILRLEHNSNRKEEMSGRQNKHARENTRC